MTSKSSQVYLNIDEQQNVLNQIKKYSNQAPFSDKIFLDHGEMVAAGVLTMSGLVFWRCAHRAFYLVRYNKARMTTLMITVVNAFCGATVHSGYTRSKLMDVFRSENMYFYGYRSIVGHQLGLLITLITATGANFVLAQRYGIIPIPNEFVKKGYRKEALNFFFTKLKPYRGVMAKTWIASSVAMFLVGIAEFRQSENLLKKINRKSIILREG